MLSLIVPAYSAGPDIQRTIASVRPYSNETVIISTALFQEDLDGFRALSDKVVELPWNYVFHHGFGDMYNQGTASASNDWLLLFGVAETLAQPNLDINSTLRSSSKRKVYKCNHHNDPNQWIRVWNRRGGTQWSGLIHETIVGGIDGGLMFRMQDTDKTPSHDQYRNESLKFIKGLSYNWLYAQLSRDHTKLGGTHPAWLKFIEGAWPGISSYLTKFSDLLDLCLSGNREGFLGRVRYYVDRGVSASGVKFEPVGQPATGEETIKSGN